jgi:actin
MIGGTDDMLQPSLIGKEDQGIHQIINASINKCEEALRVDLSKNIILGGRNCLFPGLKDRLTKEMKDFSTFKVRIISPPEVKYSA